MSYLSHKSFSRSVELVLEPVAWKIFDLPRRYFFYSIKKKKKKKERIRKRPSSFSSRHSSMRWSWWLQSRYYFVAVISRSLGSNNEMAKEPVTCSLHFAYKRSREYSWKVVSLNSDFNGQGLNNSCFCYFLDGRKYWITNFKRVWFSLDIEKYK